MTEDGNKNYRDGGDADENQRQSRAPASRPLTPRIETLQTDIYEGNADNPGQQIANEVKRVVRWGGLIAAVTMVATVSQAVTSFFELRSIDKQYRVMIEQNEVAREAIKASAANGRIETRAHVFATIDNYGVFATGAKAENISFVIENAGKTPAFDVQWNERAEILSVTALDTLPPVNVPFDSEEGLVLSPGRRYPMAFTRKFTDEELHAYTKFGHVIVLYGTVKYTDVFRETHYAPFRFIQRDGVLFTHSTSDGSDREKKGD